MIKCVSSTMESYAFQSQTEDNKGDLYPTTQCKPQWVAFPFHNIKRQKLSLKESNASRWKLYML